MTTHHYYRRGLLSFGYTHGDFSHGNIVFDSDSHAVSGLIDFEFARHMRFVDEVAYCLRCYATDADHKPHGLDLRINPEKAKVLLAAYEHHRPLPPAERQELERVIPKQLAIEARYWAHRIDASGQTEQPAHRA